MVHSTSLSDILFTAAEALGKSVSVKYQLSAFSFCFFWECLFWDFKTHLSL